MWKLCRKGVAWRSGEVQPIRADCSRNGRIPIAVSAISGKELLGIGRNAWGMGFLKVSNNRFRAAAIAAAAVAFSVVAMVQPASAAIVTRNMDIDVGFVGAEIGDSNRLQGSFTITYDDAVDSFGTIPNSVTIVTGGNDKFHLNSINYNFYAGLTYQFRASDQMMCLGTALTNCFALGYPNDFVVVVKGANSDGVHTPYLAKFFESGTEFQYADGGLTMSTVSAVPEPATWAMMIIGFGAVGSMVRTSRRRNDLLAA